MESMEQNPKPQPAKTSQRNTVTIRVSKEIARVIHRDLAKLNQKPLGRRIRTDEYVAKAIGKLNDDDIRVMREASLSSSDRLELMYHQYSKKNHDSISKEEFLGRLIDRCSEMAAAESGPNGSANSSHDDRPLNERGNK